jgi:ribosomal protein S18 acetylase RimI-like enzyme
MTTFRPIANTDIELLVSLMQEFYAIDDYPIHPEITRNLFQEFISNDQLGKAWLIFHHHEVVGYVILTFIFSFEYQGKIAFLDELYLRKNARGRGIGSQTILFIQSESHKLSLKLIYLEVEHHNENAQKLYLSTDFEMHNRLLMKHKIK